MTTPWPDAPAADPWELCEAIAREHARTFYLASRFLPRHRRRAILAAYAYCRIADDLVDCASDYHPAQVSEALARWEDELMKPRHPVAVAFAHARSVFGVPIEPVRDLFTGIRMDLAGTRFATWSALYTYSYHVAGTIGMIVAPILGCNEPIALRYAAELGIAMQLTNILRDIGEDAQRGRVYLPLDELAAFGCDVEGMLRGQPGGQFVDLLTLQAQRARALYASAERGLQALPPRSRFTALVASRLYAGILDELERAQYPVFDARVYVPARRKLLAMPGIVAAFVRLSLPSQTKPVLSEPLACPGERNTVINGNWNSSCPGDVPRHG